MLQKTDCPKEVQLYSTGDQEFYFYTNDKIGGGRVHPKNWMYRIAEWTATFENNKLSYNKLLTPMVCNGRCCLRIDKKFKKEFPEMYKVIMELIKDLEVEELKIT